MKEEDERMLKLIGILAFEFIAMPIVSIKIYKSTKDNGEVSGFVAVLMTLVSMLALGV